MAQLVIRGHATRGKEVIKILEMLGGKSYTVYAYKGEDPDRFYCINKYDNFIDSPLVLKDVQVFSLEEFLEKFPYKVGDKVIAYAEGCLAQFTIQGMRWNYKLNRVEYKICSSWLDTSLMQPYKEETMEEIKVNIPKGYEFAGIDDDKQQVVFTKIQPQYPKTYEECCKVLGINRHDVDIDLPQPYQQKMFNFFKLLICRNAYWKIAGEEMGLGKPWEPSKNDDVYCIFRLKGEIVKDNFAFGDSLILEFPTEEMRDTFYEYFKDLIEECKELL